MLGTPFNTTAPDIAARTLRIRSHDSTVLFQTTFDENIWHNFAVVVDWDKPTLQVFYSTNGDELKSVTAVEDNKGAVKGPTGVGDYHFGVLKVGPEASLLVTNFRTHILTRPSNSFR